MSPVRARRVWGVTRPAGLAAALYRPSAPFVSGSAPELRGACHSTRSGSRSFSRLSERPCRPCRSVGPPGAASARGRASLPTVRERRRVVRGLAYGPSRAIPRRVSTPTRQGAPVPAGVRAGTTGFFAWVARPTFYSGPTSGSAGRVRSARLAPLRASGGGRGFSGSTRRAGPARDCARASGIMGPVN